MGVCVLQVIPVGRSLDKEEFRSWRLGYDNDLLMGFDYDLLIWLREQIAMEF